MVVVADSEAGAGKLSALAYYYPEPFWLAQESSWIKSLLLFFDRVAILLPNYMKGRELMEEPSLAGPLTDRGLLKGQKRLASTVSPVVDRPNR
jgi:hypothetical protein